MGLLPEYFPDLTGFQWDAGNSEKNWLAHDVHRAETEQVFFNRPVLVAADPAHSKTEARYFVLGGTSTGRRLTIAFTIRGTLVRPIMAWDMSRADGSSTRSATMPKKRLKPVPQFQTEAEEREFWASHDTTQYVDWSRATRAVFPNLRPSTETISLRLPAPLLADLKALANARDVPYQSLLKVYLAEQVRREQSAAGQHNPRS